MKLITTLAATCLFGLAITAQAGVKVAACGSAEGDLRVAIFENGDGPMIAVVQMESFGGSSQSFKYPVREENIAVLGSPVVLAGPKFKLMINWGTELRKRNVPSKIWIDDLHVEQAVTCNLY